MVALLKSAVLISLFWAFYKLFLAKNTFFQWNRAFLVLGIVVAFALPFMIIPVKVVVSLDQSLLKADVTNAATQNPDTFWENMNVLTFFGIVYVIGVIFMCIRLGFQFWSLKQFLHKLPKTVTDKVFLRETSKPITAFSFFKNIVVNTEKFNSEELNQIIEHERVHIKQWHSIDMIIAQILVLVQWFNPLAWNYKKLLEQNLEFIADYHTVKKSRQNDSYMQLLLKNSVENYPLILTNSFNHSLLKNRIHMLHTPQTLNIHKWKLVLMLPVLVLFMYAFNRVEKPVYQTNEKQFTEVFTVNPVDFTVTITKQSTDADLKAIEQMLASQEVKFDLKKIKRNAKNEIVAIALEVRGKNFNANFDNDDSDGIEPILIQYNTKDQKIKIGNFNHTDEQQWTQKKNVKVIKNGDNQEEHIFFIESNGDGAKEVTKIKVIASDSLMLNGKELQWTEKEENVEGKELKKYTIILEGNDDGVTKYIINGKEVSKEELDAIDPDEIKEVQVFKKKKTDK